MMTFWLAACALLLAALAFLLIPVVRARRAQTEEDRTALNVALYQERLAELENQRAAGILSDEQFEAGRAEGARELFDDTEQGAQTQRSLGKAIPLLMALALPVVGLGLYWHWGASDALSLSQEMQQEPKSFEEMIDRLERSVAVQPDWAESWYFLGRAYMAQEQSAKAAEAFAKTIELNGRDPALLGLWAQAQYFAANKVWNDQLQALADEAITANPNESTTLGLLGIVAFEKEQYAQTVDYWQRLLAVLPPNDPSRSAIESGIQSARERGNLPAPAPVVERVLNVAVSLDPALVDKVSATDTVFVFARAESGPPMPLAAKRLTVAQLPATLSLSDKDAMMPQLTISSQPKIQLVARISREGNPTQGEWIGLGQPVANDDTSVQQLVIDQADKP